MKFCPNCGEKIQTINTKFCSECGFSIIGKNETSSAIDLDNIDIDQENITSTVLVDEENEESEYSSKNAYALGIKFEDTVEQILMAKNYSTQRRCRLDGKKGKSEIDIIAVKKYKGKEKVIAVECKNHTNPVSVKDIRDFVSKLEDLSLPNGLFVAYSDFSRDARSWGESAGLELWHGDLVSEKFYELSVGRLNAGEKIDLKYHLPVKVDFNDAINLDFENNNNIEISSAKLIWKPYYKVFYELNSVQKDPINRKHRINDSGFFIVDALIENQIQKNTVNNVIKSISFGILGKSSEEKDDEKITNVHKKELRQHPEENLTITQPDNYNVIKLSPKISQTKVRGETIDYVVKKNTKTIDYEVPQKKKKNRDDFDFDFPEIKEYTLKPSRKDASINEIQLIHVPKWEIEFESGDYTYTRVISANSGKVITDNLTNCNRHLLKGLLKKKNIALCDVCGKALCKDHIFKCPVCEKWFCEMHSNKCTDCKTQFCIDHIDNKCIECDSYICDTCSQSCPICMKIHCKNHMTTCDKCNNEVCISCIRKEGNILFKKKLCQNC